MQKRGEALNRHAAWKVKKVRITTRVLDDVASVGGEKMQDRAILIQGETERKSFGRELEFSKETIMLQAGETSLKVNLRWYWIASAPTSWFLDRKVQMTFPSTSAHHCPSFLMGKWKAEGWKPSAGKVWSFFKSGQRKGKYFSHSNANLSDLS